MQRNRLNLTDTRNSNVATETNYEENVHNDIVILRKIYHILWENTRQLNILFKWSLLLLIAGNFIVIVVNYYRILVWLLFNNPIPVEKKLNFFGIFMAYTIGQTVYPIILSNVCHNVSQQVKNDT